MRSMGDIWFGYYRDDGSKKSYPVCPCRRDNHRNWDRPEKDSRLPLSRNSSRFQGLLPIPGPSCKRPCASGSSLAADPVFAAPDRRKHIIINNYKIKYNCNVISVIFYGDDVSNDKHQRRQRYESGIARSDFLLASLALLCSLHVTVIKLLNSSRISNAVFLLHVIAATTVIMIPDAITNPHVIMQPVHVRRAFHRMQSDGTMYLLLLEVSGERLGPAAVVIKNRLHLCGIITSIL